MSLRYRDSSGNETIVSGLTPGGDIEAGAVMEKKGTWTFSSSETPIAAGAMVYKDIVFDTPMPDADYLVTYNSYGGQGDEYIYVKIGNKTVNGFRIYATNTTTTSHGIGYIKWIATKTYTVQHAAQNAEDIANIKAVIPSTASSTNQLTPKKYVDDADTALDGRVSDLEDLIPNDASVTNQLATKAEIDNVYTKTEVDTKLDNKQDALTFDNEPTAGSSNPVKSNGIKSAIDDATADIYEIIDKNGTKNLLPNRGSGTTATSYGVTFTIQDDGSVIANGTATGGQAIFQVNFKVPLKKDESYIISGGINTSKFAYVNAINNNSYVKTIGLSVGDHSSQYDMNPFTPDYVGYTHLEIGVAVNNGVTCNNDRFYPMVRLASDPDETYQPYAMTNRELTNKVVPTATSWDINSSFIPRVTFTKEFANVYKVGNVVFVNLRLTIDAVLQGGGLYMDPRQLLISNYSKIAGTFTLDGVCAGPILQDGYSALTSTIWCRKPDGQELQVSEAVGKTIWLDFHYITNE